jgi:hypothetical protein
MEDANNQLQVCCLELGSTQQRFHNKDKELAATKTYNLKLQIKNKHLVAKTIETNKAIKKAKALQHEYNELNQAHFKGRNDLKVL